MADERLLQEIRDLLAEQNRLMAAIKEQNETAMARNFEHMEKAQAQNTKALGSVGWLNWGVAAFMILLLLVFAVPTFYYMIRGT